MRIWPTNRLRTAGGTASPVAGADIHPAGTGALRTPVPPALIAPSGEDLARQNMMAVPFFRPAIYGDVQHLPFAFAVLGDQLVLPRPATGQRVFLLIENDLAAGTIRLNYDSAASATVGIPITAGGNIFFDAFVPQNDIHVFAPGGGVVQISYCVLDATNPTRVIQNNR